MSSVFEAQPTDLARPRKLRGPRAPHLPVFDSCDKVSDAGTALGPLLTHPLTFTTSPWTKVMYQACSYLEGQLRPLQTTLFTVSNLPVWGHLPPPFPQGSWTPPSSVLGPLPRLSLSTFTAPPTTVIPFPGWRGS